MSDNNLWRLKHVGTPLRDLQLHVRIDYQSRVVELESGSFDSWLVGDLVVDKLPADGVIAYADNSADPPIRPAYRIVYVLAGLRLRCKVVRL